MKSISFRRFVDEDADVFFPLLTDRKEQQLLYPVMKLNSKEEFSNWFKGCLKNYWEEYYTITIQDDVIGFTYLYEMNRLSGHAKICVYIVPEYRNAGLGVLCGIQYIENVFQHYPLRKLFAEVFSSNSASVEMCRKLKLNEEGVLKEYRFIDGRYADLCYYSLYREEFHQIVRELAGNDDEI